MASRRRHTDHMLRLQLARSARMPGDTLEGEVFLQFPTILQYNIKEVYVKLRGVVNVTIPDTASKRRIRSRADVLIKSDIVKEETIIWRQGASSPPAGHTLTLPFAFALSRHWPVTCKHTVRDPTRKTSITSEVSYYVEVVAVRSGLQAKRRKRTSFRLVSSLSRGTKLQEELSVGWNGQWKTVSREKRMRLSDTGGYAHVKFSIVTPQMEAIPSFASIPFTLNIVTTTPPMYWHEDVSSSCPIPPSSAQDIDFSLERVFSVLPTDCDPSLTIKTRVLNLGGMGPSQSTSRSGGPAILESSDKTWIPSPSEHDSKRGQWRHETRFSSSFRCICPPSLTTDLLKVEYRMRMKINLLGTEISLECELPVKIIAGSPSRTTSAESELSSHFSSQSSFMRTQEDFLSDNQEFGGPSLFSKVQRLQSTERLSSMTLESDESLQDKLRTAVGDTCNWVYKHSTLGRLGGIARM